MISQTVEYALRAVVTIAQHEGKPCTSSSISETTLVPSAYLSKLMQGLVRGGLVHSRRGKNGGFTLAHAPEDMTVYDVVQVIDPIKRISHCPLGIDSHGSTLCPLHRRLDHAMSVSETVLRETRISDVLAQPGSPTPLCEQNPVVGLVTEAPASRVSRRKK